MATPLEDEVNHLGTFPVGVKRYSPHTNYS